MFDLEKIKALQQKAVEKQWSYPYLFNSLKSIGIERYEVNVLTGETKYVGGKMNVMQPSPEGSTPRALGPSFDAEAVKAAVRRSQAREITYPQFLDEIAAAGVPFYRVDMRPRTVTYHGADKTRKHVEAVPDTK